MYSDLASFPGLPLPDFDCLQYDQKLEASGQTLEAGMPENKAIPTQVIP